MSSIIIVTGRVTADPVMQQAKNSGTEYISLGLATNQRGQNGKEEPIFYQCYCNKFLADRLIKAGVKKSVKKFLKKLKKLLAKSGVIRYTKRAVT